MSNRLLRYLSVLAIGLLTISFGRQAFAQPCCGPITPNGQRLATMLDQSGLDHLWQPHVHVIWQTGEPDPSRPRLALHVTHCSAFAAAMAARLNIYLLSPPAHGQGGLANAQYGWLPDAGKQAGWQEVDFKSAQSLANQGNFVVAVFKNPHAWLPGHIAVIRPSEKSLALLEAHGPEEAQAGLHNAFHTTIKHGFSEHPGAWEANGRGGVRFFVHEVNWSNLTH